MLRGVTGHCPDCGDTRLLLPADDDGHAFCCADCAGAVLILDLDRPPRQRGGLRRAG